VANKTDDILFVVYFKHECLKGFSSYWYAKLILSVYPIRELNCYCYKILRCIFGALQENGVWRKRYNHELYELFSDPDVVKYIKINILDWAGHVIRMDNNRTVQYSAPSQ
jgi:hypothetical protein